MSNDDPIDELLRRMAKRSMERQAAAVDTDAALRNHRGRLDSPRASGSSDRRWLAAVAAVVVVTVGIAAIAWPRGGDQELVATETVSTSPPTTSTASATDEQSTGTTTAATSASASPNTVRVGETVEITPAGSVQRTCRDIVTLTPTDAGKGLTVGQIVGGDWVPVPSPGTPVTYLACEGTTSDEPVSVIVPVNVPAGKYDLCITQQGNPAGCATIAIEAETAGGAVCESEPLTPPSLVDGTQPGDAAIEEQADRRIVRWGPSDSPFVVSQVLGFPIDASSIDLAIANGRNITLGDWQATTVPVGDPPISETTIYLRNNADGCLRAYGVGPGLYPDQADSLAESWVVALSTGEPVVAVSHSDIGLGYFGRRIAPLEDLFFEIDEFNTTGFVIGTLPDDQVTALLAQDTLGDGTGVRLEGNRSESRCVNQPLVRSGVPASDNVTTAINEARSIAVTAAGTLLATRDVCPAGTEWGDPETFSELIALDLASESPSVASLRTWQSDPDQIVFDDGNRIIAFGEQTLGDISPDGRYIALREQYASEAARWSLLDLRNDTTLLSPTSICESSGDIVGPPRFVDNTVVVIARVCASLNTGDDRQGGDVQVEAVDLAAVQPGDSIVWNSSVRGLGVDEFTGSVDLSARQDTDNTIWAIVSGNGGFDVSSQTYALHGDEMIEITRLGYQTFAFQPADLITEFDSRPT